ncbi:MAG: FAD-dependent oxidoreductase, partial [Pseudomonadota bacterium]
MVLPLASNTFTVDVAVVGAGMVGLTLANLLCKQGKSVAVIDRSQITTFENDRTIEARVTA